MKDRTTSCPPHAGRIDPRFLTEIGGALTRIRRIGGESSSSSWSQMLLNVICLDRPGTLINLTDWLDQEYGANIIRSSGGRQGPDIHNSCMTIEISNRRIRQLIKDFEMIAHEIDIPEPQDHEDIEQYSLDIFGPDQRGIFSQIGHVFTRDDRDINIRSYGITTQKIKEFQNKPMAWIEMRIEVPIRTIPIIPQILDEIRGLGHGLWQIRDGDLANDPDFTRIPIERIGDRN